MVKHLLERLYFCYRQVGLNKPPQSTVFLEEVMRCVDVLNLRYKVNFFPPIIEAKASLNGVWNHDRTSVPLNGDKRFLRKIELKERR